MRGVTREDDKVRGDTVTRGAAMIPPRSREPEQQGQRFDDLESFLIALPRGSEAATFAWPTPGFFAARVTR